MTKKIISIILLLTISLSSQADLLTSIFHPKIEKFYECQDTLEKSNIEDSFELCTDKYAKELDSKEYELGDNYMNSFGDIRVVVPNLSSHFTINKITIDGYLSCKDVTKCSRQNFKASRYGFMKPTAPGSSFLGYFSNMVNVPSELKQGEWSWTLNSLKAYGFYIDY
jgi:hypothetical protein